MARKRHKKRYPGKGRKLPLIRVDKVHSKPPAKILKSTPNRIYGLSSGGKMGNRPVPMGNDGYVNEVDVIGSYDNGETHIWIESVENDNLFYEIEFGRGYKVDREPYGTIYDENGEVLYQGKAKYAPGYAKGIFQILRWLSGDEKGPWTRKPFIMNKRANGQYFYKGEAYKKVDGKWESVELDKGDILVRPGDWNVTPFDSLKKTERYNPVIQAGKKGEAAEKAQSNVYGTSLDFEDKRQMSGDFAARFDS